MLIKLISFLWGTDNETKKRIDSLRPATTKNSDDLDTYRKKYLKKWVRVNVWHAKAGSIGHVSLHAVNLDTKEHILCSFWPYPDPQKQESMYSYAGCRGIHIHPDADHLLNENGNGDLFLNLSEAGQQEYLDKKEAGVKKLSAAEPDETIFLYTLDVDKIINHFKRQTFQEDTIDKTKVFFTKEFKWSLHSSHFFKKPNTKNCASAVYDLLKIGGVDNLVSNSYAADFRYYGAISVAVAYSGYSLVNGYIANFKMYQSAHAISSHIISRASKSFVPKFLGATVAGYFAGSLVGGIFDGIKYTNKSFLTLSSYSSSSSFVKTCFNKAFIGFLYPVPATSSAFLSGAFSLFGKDNVARNLFMTPENVLEIVSTAKKCEFETYSWTRDFEPSKQEMFEDMAVWEALRVEEVFYSSQETEQSHKPSLTSRSH